MVLRESSRWWNCRVPDIRTHTRARTPGRWYCRLPDYQTRTRHAPLRRHTRCTKHIRCTHAHTHTCVCMHYVHYKHTHTHTHTHTRHTHTRHTPPHAHVPARAATEHRYRLTHTHTQPPHTVHRTHRFTPYPAHYRIFGRSPGVAGPAPPRVVSLRVVSLLRLTGPPWPAAGRPRRALRVDTPRPT